MMKGFTATLFACLLGSSPLFAQQSAGNIAGRVIDPQGAAVPGTVVTARNPETGLSRSETSDRSGAYRLNALPVGIYEVTAELQGFSTVTTKGVEVLVSQTITIDFALKLAGVTETVTVAASRTLVDRTASSVGGIVDPQRVQQLPLNGRQFANLAATIPGVGLGFFADPTKGASNYAPQINGGAGRNINYQIDGGDDNDDTVGGLLQQFPLEAVQEFNFQTQRFKAEYGRSNGGVMNVVTKSGTNMFQGSLFELFRDKSMNALTETEKLTGLTSGNPVKGDYRRNQFGGSFGGPIAKDKVHFFFAAERTQEDRTQAMAPSVVLVLPAFSGAYPVAYRENLATGKVSANINDAQYLSIRYGHDNSGFPTEVGPTRTPDSWGDATNTYHSINVNHNWVLGGSKLNEFVFQYADFSNLLSARTTAPSISFSNSVATGSDLNAPQSTVQHKYQFRDDFSWHAAGHGGIGHDFKAGVNIINEPYLYLTANTGKGVIASVLSGNTLDSPVRQVTFNDGDASVNLPNTQYGLYIQDDWRVTNRLTVNAGLRYDLVTGLNIDQSKNPNFVAIQTAAKAGLLNGIVGLENFGLDSQPDRNNFQPRLGAVYDAAGNGRDIVRGGWGIYTDFGYTNSNILFAALDASGNRFGTTFAAVNTAGLRNIDGTLYQPGQPISQIASTNLAGTAALRGQWIDPRLQQPYQMQSNLGWSHELTSDTVVSVDFVNSLGRDLNYKPRLNQLIPGTTLRRISSLLPAALSPNSSANRPALSVGESTYNALILSARRRLSKGIDFSASYTLSSAVSDIGDASDELNVGNVQNANDPFTAPVQLGPNRTVDARHRVNISAIFQLPYGIQVAPFFLYRSALPVFLIDGRDLNGDGEVNDIPTTAYAVDSVDPATGKATIKTLGTCDTVNCGRSAPQSQLNLRVSKVFHFGGRVNVEAIGEIYNLFNALNPATANGNVNLSSGAANPALLQPQSFSGDVLRPEQRLGQIGFRVTF